MQYLCICQQPENSDLTKGHGPGSPGWAYGLSYSGRGGGVAQVGGKSPVVGGSNVQMCEDTM